MSKYRKCLPQLKGGLFMADGGLETSLIFHKGISLPHFAAFTLLRDADGRKALKQYYFPFIETAQINGFGYILDSPTWRSNAEWGAKLGYSSDQLAAANRDGIALMLELRAEHENTGFTMVISGAIGPRGDGYEPGRIMAPDVAEAYHADQIGLFAESAADMAGAFTITNSNEAIGIALAARSYEMPVMISFTLETNGHLPTGESLWEAIEAVDDATGSWPVYYMINCAHPSHFETTLEGGGPLLSRLRGLRANASRRSHAELDEAPDLDAGDPEELAAQYRNLRLRFPHLTVLGGCCGTDHRHVSCIASACRVNDAFPLRRIIPEAPH